MPQKENIKTVIQQNLQALLAEQNENGGYLSFTSTTPQDFSQAEKKFSLFPTALILSSLHSLHEEPLAQKISKNIVSYLLSQKNEFWAFNYWEKNSPDAEQTPYPDDLDDTACSLSALALYDPTLITGEVVAHFVSLLTFVEQEEGGPYKTWIVPPTADKAWQDIDLAVNSNIAYFLSLQEVSLESIDQLIDKAITEKNFSSPYYTYEYSLLYFISRSYSGLRKQELIDHILSKRIDDSHWGSALDTALCLTTLITLGYDHKQLEKSVEYLLSTPWDATAFCTELITSETTYYSGSKALTISFCLEALQTILNATETKPINKKDTTSSTIFVEQIQKEFRQTFSFLSHDCKPVFEQLASKMEAIDEHQKIILLPYLFSNTLSAKHAISETTLQQLSLANLYGWLAYTIYDDFFDLEGKSEQLSIANTSLRQVVSIYGNLFDANTEFAHFFEKTMNELDHANMWESLHCHKQLTDELTTLPQFEDLSILAQKSMGHALGPLALLAKQGYQISSKEFSLLQEFFFHYIISRQLNDDIHDWEEDLQQGMLSPIHTELLTHWKNQNQLASFTLKEAYANLPQLQSLFWHETVVPFCERIIAHVNKAKSILAKCDFMEDTTFLETLLSTSETSAKSCLTEREKTVAFLQHYTNTNQ